jgi:hypothetical protein
VRFYASYHSLIADSSKGFAQASYSGWRWIFWINLPLIGIGAVAIALFLKVTKLHGDMLVKIRNFDWFGSTIFIASIVSFLIPITWGKVHLGLTLLKIFLRVPQAA